MNKQEKMLRLARQAFASAYCPYSQFAVGACILTDQGNYYTGCNVENISYPEGTCAETGAIATMAAAGERAIAEILIIADGDDLITPCGGCRQRLLEFATPETPVHLANLEGIQQTLSLGQLFPHSFCDEKLKK